MAILHGDMLETIDAVTSTTNLEYQITSLMDDMSKKISALLAMRDDIEIRLILSSNLEAFSDSLRTLPVELGNAVDALNSEFYGRLDYQHIDPLLDASFDVRGHGALPLLLRNESGTEEEAFASLVISRGERSSTLDIITRGIFGSQQVADISYLEESISGVADSLIGVQQEIGFVSGYGIPPLTGQAQNQAPVASTQTDLANFNAVVSTEYRFRELDLDREVIPDGLETVVVVSPAERLSDYALYQLDQFFMAGKTLLLFLDSHSIFVPQQNPNQFGPAQAPVYLPRDTGLEELIGHYGLELVRGYVMDEQSFVQRQRTAQGGISEATIYYAPIIDQTGLNRELRFLATIPEMVVLNMSPVRATAAGDERVVELFTSSVEGWITRGEEINLANPFQIQPPADEDQARVPMAQLLRGRSSSYFAGREIPRPDPAEETSDLVSTLDSDSLEIGTNRIDDGGGTLVVVGGSAMIGSIIVDAAGSSGNSLFLLNLFDALSGREDYAIMRTKGAVFAPLDETTPAVRSFIKTFNIAGLPILVVLGGLGVWLFRNRRKRQIESRFSPQERR